MRLFEINLGLNMTYMNLGNTYLLQNSLDSSAYYLDKAIKGFQATNNWRFVSTSLSNLGQVLFQKKAYTEALTIVDSSQAINDRYNLHINAGKNYSLMARIYYELGDMDAFNKYVALENEAKPKKSRPKQ